MIDLHSHTYASDGTCSPTELIEEARRAGIETLGITDHDTLDGYNEAVPLARKAGIELICGIELSTKLYGNRSVHLLGYFLDGGPSRDFREWILDMQAARRDRNVRLTSRLRELGFDITLEEVQARGRGMTARPHFAQVLLAKGYVSTLQQAFDDYLDESAIGYVYRREPSFAEGVQRIRAAGGPVIVGASDPRAGRSGGDPARTLRGRIGCPRGLPQRSRPRADRVLFELGRAPWPEDHRRLRLSRRGETGHSAGERPG